MELYETKELYCKATGYKVVLGEPLRIDSSLVVYPVVFDDLSSIVESESEIRMYYSETPEEVGGN